MRLLWAQFVGRHSSSILNTCCEFFHIASEGELSSSNIEKLLFTSACAVHGDLFAHAPYFYFIVRKTLQVSICNHNKPYDLVGIR